MIKKMEYLSVMLGGGVIYNIIEIIWRGYTHWSMTCAGGICMLIIHCINQKPKKRNLFLRCAEAAVAITLVEFSVGVVVNLILKMNVWDYSDMPGNIFGQVCPLFTFLWFLLSCPAYALSGAARAFFDSIEYGEKQTT